MTVSGQLFFLGQGNPTDARLAYLNSDGSGQTVIIDNNPSLDLLTSFPQEIGLDTAAGFYFAIVNGGDGSGAHLVRGSLSGGAVVEVASYVVGADAGDSNHDDPLVNTLEVDAVNHKIYVGYQDPNGVGTNTGIKQYSYDPLTGAITDQGFLVRADQDNKVTVNVPGYGLVEVLDPRDFALDVSTNTLFFTERLDGVAQGLYRLNLSAPDTISRLVSTGQFPDDGSGGYYIDVEIDRSTHLVYFTTESQHPFIPTDPGNPDYVASQNAIWYIAQSANNGQAIKVTLNGLPAGNHFYPGDMTLDQGTRQIYVESEETSSSGAVDDVIYVFQLDASGHSATLIRTISPNPQFTQDQANIGGMAFNDLPVLGVSGTATAGVEQGSAILLATAPTITDADGGYLKSASVQITGGTFGSGETSNLDDHLGVGASQQISGLIAGTSITVSWNSATETLSLSGYDTVAHYQSVLASVRYWTTGNNPTNYESNPTRTITWTVSDGALNVPGGQQNTDVTTLTISSVNDAPVNDATPSSASGLEGAASISITGLGVSDVDAGTGLIRVTFSVGHGTLFILADGSVPGGLTAGNLVGSNGAASITVEATQAQINAALANANGLRFVPDPGFSGTEVMTMTSTDQGLTGGGGAKTDTDTINITVTAVNDPPLIDLNGAGAGTSVTLSYTEGDAVTVIAPAATVTDADSSDFNTGITTVAITTNAAAGDQLSIITDATVTIAGNAVSVAGTAIGTFTGNGGLTLDFTWNASATPAAVTEVMRHIGYSSTSESPSAAARTVQFSTTDGDGGSSGVVGTINVTPVNDVPTIAGPTSFGGTPNVALAITGLTFGDVDGGAGSETATFTATTGNFFAVSSGGVTVTGDNSHTLTLSGSTANLTSFIAASKLTFVSPVTETIHVVLNDNGNTPAPAQNSAGFDILVDFNNAPVVTATSGSGVEDQPARIAIALSGTDADAGDTVTQFTIQSLAAGGQLFTAASGGIVLAVNDVVAAIGSGPYTATVYFQPNADFYGATSFTYSGFDGHGNGAAATASITVAAVADIADNTISVAEDSGPNTLDLLGNDTFENPGRAITAVGAASHGTVTINNNGTAGDATDDFVVYTPGADYHGSDSFTYTVTSGGVAVTETANVNVTVTAVDDIATDTVTVGEDFGANTLNLLANDSFENAGRAITAVGAASHGTVVINNNGTAGDATDDFVVYTPNADFNGPDTFTYTVTSNGTTETATVNVSVSAVADIADNTVTVNEDSGATALDLLGNDTFENAGRAITAVGTALHGTVTINNNGTVGDATDDFVVYTPTANYHGSDSFTYTVTSNGATETATVNVTVASVNDAPSGADKTIVDSEDDPYIFQLSDFGFTDTDGDTFEAISIATFPAQGTLFLDADGPGGAAAVDVSLGGAGAIVSAADIAAGHLYFQPVAGTSGVGYANFTFKVRDNGGTGNGGANLDPTANTITINVAPDNVAPVAVADTLTATEDTPVTYTAVQLLGNDTDAEGNPLTISSVTSGSHGVAVLNLDGTVTFTPDANFNGAATFSYTANDGAVDSNTATATVNVAAVNDAPVATPDILAATEDTPVTYTAAQLLGNDTDVDGNPLTIASVTSGSHGTAVLNPDGTVTFTAAANFSGVADFSYKASDGGLNSNAATATVNVAAVNDAPVNTIPAPLFASSNANVAISGLAVQDPDATSSTFTTTLHVDHGILSVAAFGGAAVAGSGTSTVTLTGSVAQIDAALGAANNVLYHSQFNFSGVDHLTMTSNDHGSSGPGGNMVDSDILDIRVGAVIPEYSVGGLVRPALNLDASGHIILDGPAAAAAATYGLAFLYIGVPASTPYPPVDPAHADFHL